MPGNPGIKEEFKKIGSRFMFEFFLEVFHDRLIEAFREFLAGYTPERIKEMVVKGEFPYIPPDNLVSVKGYEQYLERIKPERFADALQEARPDLAQALEEMDMEGGLYIIKLCDHYLNLIAHPEKAEPKLLEGLPKEMMEAVCEECGKSWPVIREEFSNIKECPFCHIGKDNPSNTELLESPDD